VPRKRPRQALFGPLSFSHPSPRFGSHSLLDFRFAVGYERGFEN